MIRKEHLMKGLASLLIAFLFRNIILNCITLCQSNGNSILMLFGFILGTILALVIKGGLSLLFWYSYNIKYPNEKYNEKVLRKVFASLIFLGVIQIALSGFGSGMFLLFSICTLILIIREEKRIPYEKTIQPN